MTPDPDDIPAVLAAVDRLCHDRIPLAAAKLSPDVDALVLLLQDVRRAQAQLAWAAEELEDQIVKDMPAKEIVVAGVGPVTLRTGTKRTQWDHDGLMAAMVARIADEPSILCDIETGELLTPTQTVERVVGMLREAVTPSWKTTGLRAARINPDEYCSVAFGRKTIQLPKVEPWPDHQPQETAE
jgi:hypothetical protein